MTASAKDSGIDPATACEGGTVAIDLDVHLLMLS